MMIRKILGAASAAAMVSAMAVSGANASVRPSAAIPALATSSSAVQVHDDDQGLDEIYWIIGAGVLIGAILFVLAFDDDDDDEDLPLSLA